MKKMRLRVPLKMSCFENKICFFMFIPDPSGEMVQFDFCICFKWVGEKPLTRIGLGGGLAYVGLSSKYDRNMAGSCKEIS